MTLQGIVYHQIHKKLRNLNSAHNGDFIISQVSQLSELWRPKFFFWSHLGSGVEICNRGPARNRVNPL